MDNKHLFVPGPVNLHLDSLVQLAQDPPLHYGVEWANLWHKTNDNLKRIVNAQNSTSLILPGIGTIGIDIVFHNLISAHEPVLVVSNGFFGDRLTVQAKHMGAAVDLIEFPWNKPINVDTVLNILSKKRYKLMAFVHHDTSSGILNPLEDLCKIAKLRDVLTLVDAVSSVGGIPIEFDNWDIDFLVTVPNKCLEGIHGVVPIFISKNGVKTIRNATHNKLWSLDFNTWIHFDDVGHDEHPHPSTMPTHSILVLNKSISRILEKGLSNHYQNYITASNIIRKMLSDLGLKLFIDDKYLGPLLTPLQVDNHNSALDLIRYMKEKNIIIADALGKDRGKFVRIANMGLAAEGMALETITLAFNSYFHQRRSV